MIAYKPEGCHYLLGYNECNKPIMLHVIKLTEQLLSEEWDIVSASSGMDATFHADSPEHGPGVNLIPKATTDSDILI